MLVMSGKWANVLQEAAFAGVPSPAADPLYPVAYLIDGIPGREFAFGSAPSACNVIYDLDKLGVDGGFEAGSLGSTWLNQSSGTGTVTVVSAGTPHSGTYHAQVNSTGAGQGIVTMTKEVKTGRRYRFEVWTKNSGGGSSTSFVVLNVETGNYLQANGGTWGPTPFVFTRTSGTYGLLSANFTIESFSALGNKDTCTLWIQCRASLNVAENVFFDDARLWPEADTAAIFGNNILPSQPTQIRASTDAFGASNVLKSSMVVKRPAFYSQFTTTTERWIQCVFNPSGGSVEGNIRIGELWCGQSYTPQRALSAAIGTPEVNVDRPQIVSDFQTFALSDDPTTTLSLPVQLLNSATYKDLRNEIVERSKGSLHPLVIVPDEILEPDLIVMGKLAGAQSYRRLPPDMRETVLLIDGLPYRILIA